MCKTSSNTPKIFVNVPSVKLEGPTILINFAQFLRSVQIYIEKVIDCPWSLEKMIIAFDINLCLVQIPANVCKYVQKFVIHMPNVK